MKKHSLIKFELVHIKNIKESEYSRFYDNAVFQPVFFQYPFIKSFYENSIENSKELVFAIGRIEKKIFIILPGFSENNIFESFSFSGSDHLYFLNQSENSCAYQKLLVQYLLDTHHTIKLSNFLAIDSNLKKELLISETPGFSCPFINLPDEYGIYLKNLNKSFRKKIRWENNSAQKTGIIIKFIINDHSQSTKTHLNRLYYLHKRRIKQKNQISSFINEDNMKFHDLLLNKYNVKAMFSDAWYNDECIGSMYGFIDNKTYYYFNSGHSNGINNISVGSLLISNTIMELIKKGIENFDFLRGTERYKYYWTKSQKKNYYYYIGRKNEFGLRMKIKIFNDYRKRYRGKIALKKIVSDII